MAMTDTTSLETAIQHFHKTSNNPAYQRNMTIFCKKVLHIYYMKTVNILQTYLNGLALGCQDFKPLQLRKRYSFQWFSQTKFEFYHQISCPHFFFFFQEPLFCFRYKLQNNFLFYRNQPAYNKRRPVTLKITYFDKSG